jgi:hypothetical protein
MMSKSRLVLILVMAVLASLLLSSTVLAQDGLSGSVGFWTWMTVAEFDYIKVTASDGSVLYSTDFDDPAELDKWITISNEGEWEIADGVLRQNAMGDCRLLLALDESADWSNYTIESRARKISGNEGFFFKFAVKPGWLGWDVPDRSFTWAIGGWCNRLSPIKMNPGDQHTDWRRMSKDNLLVNGTEDLEAGWGAGESDDPGEREVQPGEWYDIKIVLDGYNVKCFFNGEQVKDVNLDEAFDLSDL